MPKKNERVTTNVRGTESWLSVVQGGGGHCAQVGSGQAEIQPGAPQSKSLVPGRKWIFILGAVARHKSWLDKKQGEIQ